jgi:hypothetical protein
MCKEVQVFADTEDPDWSAGLVKVGFEFLRAVVRTVRPLIVVLTV